MITSINAFMKNAATKASVKDTDATQNKVHFKALPSEIKLSTDSFKLSASEDKCKSDTGYEHWDCDGYHM